MWENPSAEHEGRTRSSRQSLAPLTGPRSRRGAAGRAVPRAGTEAPEPALTAPWRRRRSRAALSVERAGWGSCPTMGRAMGLAGLLLGLVVVPAVLVSTSLRHGVPRNEAEPEPSGWELAADAVPEDSLWPLPQWVRTYPRQLQLAPSRFQLVHGAGSSAGPSCGLLQDAFRRWAAAGPGCCSGGPGTEQPPQGPAGASASPAGTMNTYSGIRGGGRGAAGRWLPERSPSYSSCRWWSRRATLAVTGTRSSPPARPVSTRSPRPSFPGFGSTVTRLLSYHVSSVEVSRFWGGFFKELESEGSRKPAKTFHGSGDQKIILALDTVGSLSPQWIEKLAYDFCMQLSYCYRLF